MPNWCMNTLTLQHDDPEMLQRAYDALERGEFLNEFIPIPTALKNTTAGSFSDPEVQQNLETLQEINASVYEYKDWYDFCVNEWGTKWDVGNAGSSDLDDGVLNTVFDSAWAPPIDAYRKLEDLGFRVSAMYYEPGMGFAGKYSDGDDEYCEIGDMTADEVEMILPEEVDEYFNISEYMRENENEEEEEE